MFIWPLQKKKIREKQKNNLNNYERKSRMNNSFNYNMFSPITFRKESNFSQTNLKEKKKRITYNNKFFLLRKNSKESINNNSQTNYSVQGFYDKRFKHYENLFNENISELNAPIKNLLRKKLFNKTKLPKLHLSNSYSKFSV